MATLNNVWDKLNNNELPKNNTFVIIYGNEYHGDLYTKQELLKNYKLILKRAFNQDVSVYFNGKIIRGIKNFNQKVTNKNVRYYQEIIKYV